MDFESSEKLREIFFSDDEEKVLEKFLRDIGVSFVLSEESTKIDEILFVKNS